MVSLSSIGHVSECARLRVLRPPLFRPRSEVNITGSHRLAREHESQPQLGQLEQKMALSEVGTDPRMYRDRGRTLRRIRGRTEFRYWHGKFANHPTKRDSCETVWCTVLDRTSTDVYVTISNRECCLETITHTTVTPSKPNFAHVSQPMAMSL